MKAQRVTIHTLRQMKERGEKIAVLTAYDATFARLFDDSIYHCRAVMRGVRRAHVVGDMPFMTYQASIEQGLTNAGRLMKEGGCHSIKLEGGAQHAELVKKLVASG